MASVIFECRQCQHVWSKGPIYGAKCPECGSYGPIVDHDEEFYGGYEPWDAMSEYELDSEVLEAE